MPSRKKTTRKTKNSKSGFLRKRFLKIPIWIWLILLIIGAVNSNNTSTVPKISPSSSVETIVADISHEETTESTLSIESTNIPSIESATILPTSEPTVTQSVTATPTITPVPTNTPAPTNDPTKYVLKRGDNNDNVRQLQKRLIALGYLTGSADGDFGPKTEKAVLAYQRAAGLPATGLCDYYTYQSMTSSNAPVAPKPTATVKPAKKASSSSSSGSSSGGSYIGNKNTKKFHHSWCSSVDQMKDSNKVSLSSRDAAISKGYDPCKRCDP